MDFTAIFEFLKSGNPERVGWLVFAFIVFSGVALTFVYLMFDAFIGLLKKMFPLFTINRKERVVEVPKYITSPESKEIEKYIAVLKKIVDEHNSGIKIT